MYHAKIAQKRLNNLADGLRKSLDPAFDFKDWSPEFRQNALQKLENAWDDATQTLKRQLQPNELVFVQAEIARSKADFNYWLRNYCNTPEAPIWMADGTFKPIGEVVPGDLVVGWADLPGKDKAGRKAKDSLVVSTVLVTQRRIAPLVKVTMESGTIFTCTPDHLWEAGQGRSVKYKNKAGETKTYPWTKVKPGKYINKVVTPVSYQMLPDNLKPIADWLGGIFDGEGTISDTGCITLAQNAEYNPEVCKKIEHALVQLGFQFVQTKAIFRINGGRDAAVRFWNLCRPVKWADRFPKTMLGGLFRQKERIVSVEPIADGEVVSMQTSTGNYIAWGYASKNCYIKNKDAKLVLVKPTSVQELFLNRIADEELKAVTGKTGDGILLAVLKARQLGISTISECIIAHRVIFYGNIAALIASDVDDHTINLYEMVIRVLENLPWWMVPRSMDPKKDYRAKNALISFYDQDSIIRFGSGKNMQGGKHQEKGSIGTGQTLHQVHISEFALWPNAEQIYDSLMPAIPMSMNAFMVLESTAKGRNNEWHRTWERAKKGLGRLKPVFFPYYTDPKDYRLPAPSDWSPAEHTTAHAKRVFATSHKWVGRSVELTRDQMFWYEQTYAQYKDSRMLYKFLAEYCADDLEAFQASSQGVFPSELIDDIRQKQQIEPVLVEVRPKMYVPSGQ